MHDFPNSRYNSVLLKNKRLLFSGPPKAKLHCQSNTEWLPVSHTFQRCLPLWREDMMMTGARQGQLPVCFLSSAAWSSAGRSPGNHLREAILLLFGHLHRLPCHKLLQCKTMYSIHYINLLTYMCMYEITTFNCNHVWRIYTITWKTVLSPSKRLFN